MKLLDYLLLLFVLSYQFFILFCFCFHIIFQLMLHGKMGSFGPDTLVTDFPFHIIGVKNISRSLFEFPCFTADLLPQCVHILAAFAGGLFEFLFDFFLHLFDVFYNTFSFHFLFLFRTHTTSKTRIAAPPAAWR